MEHLVDQALFIALRESGAITAYTSEVYPDIAPSTAGATYIIVSQNAGNYDNDISISGNKLNYLIKAVSTNLQTADNIAAAIYDLFDEQALSLSGGVWTNYRTQIIQPVRFAETAEDRNQYFHRGYIVRIRNSK